jgi:hypothetical protein
MSGFLGQGGTGGLGAQLLQQSDDRVMPSWYQWDYAGTRSQSAPWDDGRLWTSSRMGLGGADGYLGKDFSNTGKYATEAEGFEFNGGAQVKKIVGTTRDSAGNPLGSCIVQGFLTATDTFVGQMTSDSGGYFELPTPYTGAHYVVAYKAGSPDVAGTTVNTLTPV